MALAPRWRGTWSGADGYRYAFDLVVQRDRKGTVDGHFDWTLLAAPEGSKLALRVGDSGRELVRGAYDASRGRLVLKGYGVSDPVLLATDEYQLFVNHAGTGLMGQARGSGDAWRSEVRAETR